MAAPAAPPTGMASAFSPLAMHQSIRIFIDLVDKHLKPEDSSIQAVIQALFLNQSLVKCTDDFSPLLVLVGKNFANASLMQFVKAINELASKKSIVLFREGIVEPSPDLASYVHELEGSPAYFLRLFLTHYLYDRYPGDVVSSGEAYLGLMYLHYFFLSPFFQKIWHRAWSSAEGKPHRELMRTFTAQLKSKETEGSGWLGITFENWKPIFRELALATATEIDIAAATSGSEKGKGGMSRCTRLICSDDPEAIGSVRTNLYPLLDSLREIEAVEKVVRVVASLPPQLRELPKVVIIHANRIDSFARILNAIKVRDRAK